MRLRVRHIIGRDSSGRIVLGYKTLAIVAGAAAFIALAAQPVTAQSGPDQSGPPQSGPPQPGPPQPGPPPGPPQSGDPSQAPPAVVNTTVNLRQGPGTSYTVINKIPAGSPVDVGNCSGQWCQVTWQGQNGYVIATSLAQGGGGAPPPGAPPPGAVAGGPPPPGYYGPYYGAPPPYYGPYYYGYGPYYGRPRYYGYGYGWHRHW